MNRSAHMEEFHHQIDCQFRLRNMNPPGQKTKYTEIPIFILKEAEFNSEGSKDKGLRRGDLSAG